MPISLALKRLKQKGYIAFDATSLGYTVVPDQTELLSETLFQETKSKILIQQLFSTHPPGRRKRSV